MIHYFVRKIDNLEQEMKFVCDASQIRTSHVCLFALHLTHFIGTTTRRPKITLFHHGRTIPVIEISAWTRTWKGAVVWSFDWLAKSGLPLSPVPIQAEMEGNTIYLSA
jgi:hypothetical protein